MEAKMEDVPLSSFVFKNTSIDDSVSHGDQGEESFPHYNDNMYYEESDVNDNKNAYEDDDIDNLLT